MNDVMSTLIAAVFSGVSDLFSSGPFLYIAGALILVVIVSAFKQIVK